ncbi:MAG: type II toxin-antitoxin system Phd/YefM family antitoxin [Candidatus Paceibacterota bacterium]
MKKLSTTELRNNLSDVIDQVTKKGVPVVVGRRGKSEAVVIRYPEHTNMQFNEITNLNTYSEGFNFLKNEPDLYSIDDLKKRYV